MSAAPLVFVTVGTDPHPFDRLVLWADGFARTHRDVRVVVQHGLAQAPSEAQALDYADPDTIRAWIEAADAVVCHGGPTTIMESRAAGRKPIVVPRRARLGEHVDDHQMRFAERLAGLGRVVLPGAGQALTEAVEWALSAPEPFRVPPEQRDTSRTTALLADLIRALVA